MGKNYDFSGWATKNDLKCSDGRIIRRDAFKENDGAIVPLVWNHRHNEPDNILGHALLENREDGVYAYCTFNDTESGKNAKKLVEHGDIKSLSIYANKLKQQGPDVLHGLIREVSLVLAGANPAAFIDNVVVHGEEAEDLAIICTGEEIELCHSEESEEKANKEKGETKMNGETEEKKENPTEKTVQEVLDTLNEEQKTVVYALVGMALEENENENENKGDKEMKHNVFSDSEENYTSNTISHSDVMAAIDDAKKHGSMKESFIEHGIEDIEYLFPDNKTVTATPLMIDRDQTWVGKVMKSVSHTAFSRIKSVFADITKDEARARGYTKGKKKIDEVFSLLKRKTDPTTVYKKQSIDRDDVVDITDFDVIAMIKGEMRGKLDEELARAFLIGDGRLASSDDKIDETRIRPIWKDDELFVINTLVGGKASERVREFIKACIRARKSYKGSGNPTLYTTEDMVTECLLLTDNNGRDLYDSVEKLATKLRVKEIVTVPVMENVTRTVKGKTHELLGIIVNLADYSVGADKGGAVNMFDDFDIDYNKQKYLIETRCSGALTKPFSAIVLEAEVASGESEKEDEDSGETDGE